MTFTFIENSGNPTYGTGAWKAVYKGASIIKKFDRVNKNKYSYTAKKDGRYIGSYTTLKKVKQEIEKFNSKEA